MNNPLLSILMLYRTPPWVSGYPNRDIKEFLKDFNKNFVGTNANKIELSQAITMDDTYELRRELDEKRNQ